MDATAGLEHCLDICGFAAADFQRIVDIEGITYLADVESFTNRKIYTMAKDSESRRTAPERLVFGKMRVKKFKALSYWVKDQVRRGLVPDPLAFDTAALVVSMDAMRADADFKEVLAKEDIKVPVFVSVSDFGGWMTPEMRLEHAWLCRVFPWTISLVQRWYRQRLKTQENN